MCVPEDPTRGFEVGAHRLRRCEEWIEHLLLDLVRNRLADTRQRPYFNLFRTRRAMAANVKVA